MRENRLEIVASWVEEAAPRQSMPLIPLMVDKATDTSLDQESFSMVPCTCRRLISDLDSYDSEEISITNQTTSFGFLPTATLRQCVCVEQRGHNLLDAVFTGNSELLGLCLEYEVDVNSRDAEGDTILHIVSSRGDTEMLSFLLTLPKINVNAQNSLGFTPLSTAVMNRHNEAAELLLENGADPNIPDNKGRTPIFFSVQTGNVKITEKLLDFNADVNVVDTFGNNPLEQALMEPPMLTMVKVLLSRGANPLLKNNRLNPFLETVLACTTQEEIEMVKVLLDTGIDVNVLQPFSNRNCLHLVAINGNLPLAEYLVSQGADLEQMDISGKTPDVAAYQEKNMAVYDFFLKAKLLRRIFQKQRAKQASMSRMRLTMATMFKSDPLSRSKIELARRSGPRENMF